MQIRLSRCLPALLVLVAGSVHALAQEGEKTPEAQVETRAKKQLPAGEHTTPRGAEVLKAWSERYHQHIFTIADPAMGGRAPGTEGITKASNYIEEQVKSFGLKPAFAADGKDQEGPRVSYRQTFKQGGKLVATKQDVRIEGQPALTEGKDFSVLGHSGSADVTAGLIFAGYSIEAGENGYASYPEGVDLKGKIAVILRFEPLDEKGHSRWNSGSGWSLYAGLDQKIAAAFAKNAAGVIVVNPPGCDDARSTKLENLETLPSRRQQSGPVIMMSQDAAESLVKLADPEKRSLMDLRKLADESGVVIDLPGAKVSMNVATERVATMTDNIAGILPGRGSLAEQYIIIGSHYDHLGTGSFGSLEPASRGKIHPGADDNGSGTSGNLLLAEQIAKYYATLPADKPMRSIMFQWYSAEESGLNGSRYYTKNMIAPTEKHAFMLNMDMIGRLRDGKLEVTGTATAEGLKEWITPYFEKSGLTIAPKPGGLGPSDHQSFFLAKVPVLFFFTGLHGQYHRPADTVDLINCEGAAQVCDLVSRIAVDLAALPEAMAFSNSDDANRSETPMADSSKPAAHSGGPQESGTGTAQPAPARSKVRFGIAPGDYSGSEPGVLVGDVYDGTSAKDAGLQSGDLITSWNGKPVRSVEDWMPLLSSASPGDEVTVEFRRKGEIMSVKAKLRARADGNN